MYIRLKRFGALLMVVSLLLSITVIPPAQAIIDETLTLGFGEPRWVKIDDEGLDVEDPDTYSGTMWDAVYVPITVTGEGDTVGVSSGQLYLSFDKDVLEYFYMDADDVPPVKVGKNLTKMALNGVDNREIYNANGYVVMVPNSSKTHTVQSGETLVTVVFILKDSSVDFTTLTLGAMVDGALSTELVNKIVTAEDDSGYQEIRTEDPLTLEIPKSPDIPESGYVITLDANGGTVSPDSVMILADGIVPELPVPERDSCRFDGWFTAREGGVRVSEKDKISENTTLYAHWTRGYTVTFYDYLGNGSSIVGRNTVFPGDTFSTPKVERNGYRFMGWYTDSAVEYTQAVADSLTRDLTVFGRWSSASVTITLDPNGGIVEPDTITADAGEVVELPDAVWAGHRFDGWFTDEGESVSGKASFFEDTILYAQWTQQHTITFVLDGKTELTLAVPLNADEEVPELPIPARAGYVFAGWKDEEGQEYPLELADILKLAEESGRDLTLYGQWTEAVYTVHFDPGDGNAVSGTMEDMFVSDNSVILPDCTFTALGQRFRAWVLDGTTYLAGEEAEITGDTVFTASWEKIPQIRVSFNVNDGVTSISPVSSRLLYVGEPYGSLPDLKETDGYTVPDGYSFVGWFTDRDSGELVTEDSLVPDRDHTIYAHWERNGFFVDFDGNGADSANPQSIRVYTGQPYSSDPFPVVTRTGYQLLGWFRIGSDGTKTQVTPETIVTDTTAHTLYAEWEKMDETITVIFDPNGGLINVSSKTVTVGQPYGELPEPSKRTIYTFTGWFTEPEGGQQVTADTIVEKADAAGGNSQERRLYARWTKTRALVVFDGNDEAAKKLYPDSRAYVSPSSATKVIGESYGELAEAIMDHFVLKGWALDPDGEQPVTLSTIMRVTNPNDPITLYAQWMGAAFKAKYSTNGGYFSTPTDSEKNCERGQPFGYLPTPKRDGYEFAGWYASLQDANGQNTTREITPETIAPITVPDTLILTANWVSKEASAFVVTLDATGGKVYPDEIMVKTGGTYADLPNPERAGFQFNGWYTSAEGGSQIVSTSPVKESGAHTLYAHWRAVEFFDVTMDAFSFGNRAESFGYNPNTSLNGDDYPIPYSSFKMIYGDSVTGKMEYDARRYSGWGGNCNGMSSAAALYFLPHIVDPSDFTKPNTSSLSIHDTNGEFTVLTLIEALQIAQYTQRFAEEYSGSAVYTSKAKADSTKLPALFQAIREEMDRRGVTLLAIGKRGTGAHALLAYRWEESENRLFLYDCNYPGQVRSMELTTDASGGVTGWQYDMGGYGLWGTHDDDCYVAHIPISTMIDIWNSRGVISGNYKMLTVNSGDLSLKRQSDDGKWNTVAEVVDGELSIYSDDIYAVPELSIGTQERLSLYVPKDSYQLIANDGEGLSARMSDENMGAELQTTANKAVIGVADDEWLNSVQIHDATEEDTYAVKLASGYDEYGGYVVKGNGVLEDLTSSDGSVESRPALIRISYNMDTLSLPSAGITSVDALPDDIALDKLSDSLSGESFDASTLTASADVSNAEKAILVGTIYSAEGRFLRMSVQHLEPGANRRVSIPFPAVTLPKQYTVKLVLMDSLDNANVLCDPRVIS